MQRGTMSPLVGGLLLMVFLPVPSSSSSSRTPPPTLSHFRDISWPYDGFSNFPALWFGANASGLDSDETLALISRHGLAGYGWQQGRNITSSRHGEVQLAQAATHLKDYVTVNPARGGGGGGQGENSTRTKVFVYRHSQMAWTPFDIQRGAVLNPANTFMFLTNSSGHVCAQADNWSPLKNGLPSPLYQWWGNGSSSSSAIDFWVNEVVSELSFESGVDAVFFDETDWSYCNYNYMSETGCATPTQTFLQADYRGKINALIGTAQVLNNAGKLPIFSSINYFNTSRAGLSPGFQWNCVLDFHEYANALKQANVSWMRFEEIWMNYQSELGGTKADIDAMQIASAIELWSEYGVPIVVHSMAYPGNCSTNATTVSFNGGTDRDVQRRNDEGSLSSTRTTMPLVLQGRSSSSSSSSSRSGSNSSSSTGWGPVDLVYSMATFLLVQQPYSYFGVSSGDFWYDDAWCWHKEYDLWYGSPLADATRTSTYSWYRNFTGCDVEVDTSQGLGVIRMK